MATFVQSERVGLRESALNAGPDAPTLCDGWTVLDLLAHLVVREGSPLGSPGIVAPPLAFLTERAMARATAEGLDGLVERLHQPPLWSPFRIPVVDRLANTLELFVHHEDIRRARTGWTSRELDETDQRAIWHSLGAAGKGLVRPAGMPVSIRWPVAGSERVQVLRGGADPVLVSGHPAELTMFLFGRAEHDGLDFTGPEDRVAALRAASLGI